MQREIKFRVWDVTNGMVFDPAFMVPQAGQVGINDMLGVLPNVMQYTGLKDDLGGEIYEGDILRIKLGASIEEGERIRIEAVEYFQPYAAFCIRGIPLKDFSLCPKFIIGNIYENPDLLN